MQVVKGVQVVSCASCASCASRAGGMDMDFFCSFGFKTIVIGGGVKSFFLELVQNLILKIWLIFFRGFGQGVDPFFWA